MQGIDKYIWLVGQIITEPSLKQLLSKDGSSDLATEPRTPDFSGYASSEVIINRLIVSFLFYAYLDACR